MQSLMLAIRLQEAEKLNAMLGGGVMDDFLNQHHYNNHQHGNHNDINPDTMTYEVNLF